jgi:hypothetical protein
MKKIFLRVLLAAFSLPVFGQTITEYFPVAVGNTWTYANASGKTTDVVMLKNSMSDSKDGITLYLFEQQMVGLGTVSFVKSVKDNKIIILTTKDALGRYHDNSPPYPVELAPANQEWSYKDRGDDLRYKTSKAACAFDGKTYSDCILVEERIVAGSTTLRTKKSYYAKGVGLVYVTLESPREKETVFMKLTESNIKTSQAQISQENSFSAENMAEASYIFFKGLAQGIDIFPYIAVSMMQSIDNESGKTLFLSLVNTMTNDVQILADMAKQHKILKIKTFLDTPFPEYLTASLNYNKFITIGIDRAIKVIVLSCFLQEVYAAGNESIERTLAAGTKTSGPILKSYFTQDLTIGTDGNEIIDSTYSAMLEIYLDNGGK